MTVAAVRNPIHSRYHDAITADNHYSAVIHALYGPKATRWTLSAVQSQHPEVVLAYQAMQVAMAAYSLACAELDNRRHE